MAAIPLSAPDPLLPATLRRVMEPPAAPCPWEVPFADLKLLLPATPRKAMVDGCFPFLPGAVCGLLNSMRGLFTLPGVFPCLWTGLEWLTLLAACNGRWLGGSKGNRPRFCLPDGGYRQRRCTVDRTARFFLWGFAADGQEVRLLRWTHFSEGGGLLES